MQAPYLFSRSGVGTPAAPLTVTSDLDTNVLELSVHGRWSVSLRQDVYRGIYKCMAEHPAALLIDLREMTDPDGLSVAMWLAARRAGTTLQPTVRVALCVPPRTLLADRLRAAGARRYLSIFDTMVDARTVLAGSMPLPDLLRLWLPPEPESARLARDLVDQACHAWQLPQLMDSAGMVMAELATNGIRHAGTNILVTVARRGTGLYLSVRDGDPRLPALIAPAAHVTGQPGHDDGRGLRMVHASAAAWGARTTGNGKIVWVTLRSGKPSGRRP
jgi:hypothetical protein